MINIVLFGAPGCGKGTQAQRLKEHYGIDHVSTGEVIRDEIRRGTELGRSMEQYIKEGRLAPDEIVIGMIANYVAGHKEAKGCIFDGFPRTTVQAEEFDRILAGHGLKVDIMVDIHVPEEELVKRILLRGKDSGRADDASEEVIRGRLDVYRKQTAVVADYYASQNKYASVDGVGTMDEVFGRIAAVIDGLKCSGALPPRKKLSRKDSFFFSRLRERFGPAFGRPPLPGPSEGVHVKLDGALEVGGLVLVHDVVLGQLVEHSRYLRKQGLGGALLGRRAQSLHGVAGRLVIQAVVRTLGHRLTDSFLR